MCGLHCVTPGPSLSRDFAPHLATSPASPGLASISFLSLSLALRDARAMRRSARTLEGLALIPSLKRTKQSAAFAALCLSPRLTRSTSSQTRPPQRSSLRPRVKWAVAVGILGSALYWLQSPTRRNEKLNRDTFVPYTVVARQTVSPSSFVLTITPRKPDASPSFLLPSTCRWRHPLWSVEFMQPQVQIARHYTPLPPLPGEDVAEGQLRFYIRALGDGEMSRYLGRQCVGQDVWLRGPHVGIDLLGRLGREDDLVFLAGGTGVAPGLQAAQAVLEERSTAKVTLMWSIRERRELDGVKGPERSWLDLWRKRIPVEVGVELDDPSPIGLQLKQLKARFGDRLKVYVAIDEDHTQFQPEDILAALVSASSGLSTGSPVTVDACQLHSQASHENVSELRDQAGACDCIGSAASKRGKKLLVVSGPEGFISHFAGPKVWRGGQHAMGTVGGVAADLQRRHPRIAEEWLVLKL